ncbi:hypothetical protein H5410_039010 [Solanum commersonii]|uniref:Uncharacterized protein n=1 Tax=Solanum commersonii TaxID=4109 RepID=A0A9J5YC82_SOLCO|nr:hypothetical protein H5410_039010 [Solanum commersonii]
MGGMWLGVTWDVEAEMLGTTCGGISLASLFTTVVKTGSLPTLLQGVWKFPETWWRKKNGGNSSGSMFASGEEEDAGRGLLLLGFCSQGKRRTSMLFAAAGPGLGCWNFSLRDFTMKKKIRWGWVNGTVADSRTLVLGIFGVNVVLLRTTWLALRVPIACSKEAFPRFSILPCVGFAFESSLGDSPAILVICMSKNSTNGTQNVRSFVDKWLFMVTDTYVFFNCSGSLIHIADLVSTASEATKFGYHLLTDRKKALMNQGFIFWKLPNHDDYSLWVLRLFNVYDLGVGDEIGLYWDPRFQMVYVQITSKLELARSLVDGSMVRVGLWDVTEQNDRPYRKYITPENIVQGKLGISSFETSEYILPYWRLNKAKSLVNGGLDVGDEIALFWDPRLPAFILMLLSKTGDSINRLVSID